MRLLLLIQHKNIKISSGATQPLFRFYNVFLHWKLSFFTCYIHLPISEVHAHLVMRDGAWPAGHNVDEVILLYKTSGSNLARDFYVLPFPRVVISEFNWSVLFPFHEIEASGDVRANRKSFPCRKFWKGLRTFNYVGYHNTNRLWLLAKVFDSLSDFSWLKSFVVSQSPFLKKNNFKGSPDRIQFAFETNVKKEADPK